MKQIRHVMALVILICNVGCANYVKTAEFASSGNKLSSILNDDAIMLRTSCADLVAQNIKLNSLGDTRSSNETSCKLQKEGIGELVAMSIKLLDEYHKVLGALSNNTNWQLSDEFNAVGSSAATLSKRIDSASTLNITGYATATGAIFDAITSAMQNKSARYLLKDDLNWSIVLKPIQYLYGGATNAPNYFAYECARLRDDWNTVLGVYKDYAKCDVKNKCEPLLVYQIVNDEINPKIKSASQCSVDTDGKNAQTAARVRVIDEWINANEAMRKDAFKADFSILNMQIKDLINLRDAIRSVNN